MGSQQERKPISLKAVDALLTGNNQTIATCPYGVITSSDEGLDIIGKHDGVLVNKNRNGIMSYPNELSGGDRSAFCPIESPNWKLRRVLRKNFSANQVEQHQPEIQHASREALEMLVLEGTHGNTHELSRKLTLFVGEKTIFGISSTNEELTQLSDAYVNFNSWCVKNAVTRGFADMGRSPKTSYRNIVENTQPSDTEKTPLTALSHIVYKKSQEKVNESLQVIASHALDVWNHIKNTNHPLALEYQKAQEELGLSESDIVLELTGVIGGIVSSPSSFLSFSLSRYARFSDEERAHVDEDATRKEAYFHEIQRMYQPLPWLLRDIEEPIELDGKTYDKGNFTFLIYAYNRRPDVWGEDAGEFHPQRFVDNPDLQQNLLFFGKGKRRCPAGKFGETMARELFDEITKNYDIHATGPIDIDISETMYPKGEIEITKRLGADERT